METEKTIKTESREYNEATNKLQLFHEEVNSAYNHSVIIEKIKNKKARDISDEVKVDNLPCIIVGSGPSFDDAAPYLKDWKGGLICSTSQALTLIYYGIEPSHILALDPFCRYEEIEGIDWSKTRTKLIAHPGVWPDLIEKWPNDILLYLENNGKADSFYNTTQRRMYSWREFKEKDIRLPIFNFYIRTSLTLFACSPPLQLFAAQNLGYKNIFLVGCDFSFNDKKERFTSYTPINGEWVKKEYPINENNENIVITNNGLKSEKSHLYYKKNFISAWRLSEQTIYTTDHGSLIEVPYTDIKKVIRKQGYGYQKQFPQFIAKKTETYLAGIYAFCVETKLGKNFIESSNPEVELMEYMESLYRQYTCDICKTNLTCDNLINQDGCECPVCKKGKLYHSVDIDIEYNIHKFIRLLELNGIESKIENWIKNSLINKKK